MKKWKIHFIPQTHWDKEWYFTKHVSDIFLVDNIEKLYQIFKRDKNELVNFVYDGQYSVIDDYLEYHPEDFSKIKEMVQAKFLILGPWYTQTDTINASGESIVRNLLVGTKLTEKLGEPMRVGYLPDSFGFNGNLPQILKKSNLKSMIHWRGIWSKDIENGIFNKWQGIDGTEVPIINLFKWGYGVGVSPSLETYRKNWTIENMKEQAKIYYDKSLVRQIPVLEDVSKNTNGHILMPFGSDQLPVYDGVKQWMAELNKLDPNHEWEISNYDKYMDELLKDNDWTKNEVIKGEMRYGQYSRAHKTITSSRYDIKLKVRELEDLIYNHVEPLTIIFESMGGKASNNLILKNQKKLLESQAHDSLGGCNTDETNRTIIERLSGSIDNLKALSTLMRRRITEFLKLKKDSVIIFNLKPYKRSIKKVIRVFTKVPKFNIFENGKQLNFDIINQQHINIKTFEVYDKDSILNNDYSIDENGQFWTDIEIEVADIDGLSWKILEINEVDSKISLNFDKGNTIENDFYKISVENKNQITLHDKINNKIIKDAFKFESEFDAGDSYDFSPSLKNPGPTSKLKKASHSILKNSKNNVLKLNMTYDVKESLDSVESIEQNLSIELHLNEKLIEFSFSLVNKAKDIKWKLICDTNIKAKKSYGDTSFGIAEREIHLDEPMSVWEKEKWHDCPIEIESMESVCYVKNDLQNYGVIVNGNNEYQIIGKNDDQICLTLFRGYSNIGRRYLKYRPGRASGIDHYPHQTPESNLNKFVNVKFAIFMNLNEDNVVRKAKEWQESSVYYQVQDINPFHNPGDSFVLAKNPLTKDYKGNFNLDIDNNLVVSAIKKSFDNKGIILRIYNPTSKEIDLNLPKGWFETDLMENKLKGNSINKINKNEVKTFMRLGNE